ncbi:hypothetical protein HYU22_02285 [Candidatus Woesearchaeota archaeon]|nr:hypothetical protein [Candidatus Woesearchaeota archaeon]
MPTTKEWTTINLSLIIIVLLLTLNLAGIKLPSLGQAIYALDREPPLLAVEWKGEITKCDDLNRCCLEALEQVECVKQTIQSPLGKFSWSCRNSQELQYRMNNKAYSYCQQQPWS